MKLADLKSRYDIGSVLNDMGLTGVGAEIGVAFGENAEFILDKSNLSLLWLVDPWDYVLGENPKGFADAIKDWQGCYDYCAAKMARFGTRAVMLRMSSQNASKAIRDESLDFCYIDANHMAPHIQNDLECWFPKVKVGGIFGGHDYHMVHRKDYQCDVQNAVDDFFFGRSEKIHIVPDECPSWYVIKES